MSAETDALEAYLKHTGVPYKVTSTTGGQHAPTSYHYRGLAVDFAGPVPSTDSAALHAVWSAFVPIEGQLAELIYAGAPYQIKHGKHVAASYYGSQTMNAHHNHVHVAVEAGWRWAPPGDVFVSELACPTGGVWKLKADGAIFAYDGAPYKGGANGKDYFVGRVASHLEPYGDGYTIVATSNERYDYPG